MEEIINEAMQIVKERAERENKKYNDIALYWKLRGLYEREGAESVINFVSNAPFQKDGLLKECFRRSRSKVKLDKAYFTANN